MAALGSASFFFICFLVCCSSAALTNEIITAELGQEVILPCKAPNIITFRAVEWTRPGLKPDHVLFYRNGRLDPDNQHPSYQDRVDLQDKDMKEGDFSLHLKNLTKNDTGRYECWVGPRRTNRRKRSILKPISIITLEVRLSGEKFEGDKNGGDKEGIGRGHLGVLGVILLVAVLASVGSLIFRRFMRQNPNIPVPPDEAAGQQML